MIVTAIGNCPMRSLRRYFGRIAAMVAVMGIVSGCSRSQPDLASSAAPANAVAVQSARVADRRELLARLIQRDNAEQTGLSLTELEPLALDEALLNNGVSRALGELLEDQTFTASVTMSADGRQILQRLHIGAAAGGAGVELSEPVIAAGIEEPAITELAERFALENAAERRNTIDEVELTLGGVEFLGEVINSQTSQEVQLAAISRLDLGEELGAKQLLLETLSASDDTLVMAALESVQRWSDPTTLNNVKALTTHSNSGIRAAAQLLVDDLSAGYGGASASPAPITVDPKRARKAALENAQRMEQMQERQKDYTPN